MIIRTKVIVLESIEFLVIALALFMPAGTVAWTAGWVFLGLLFVCRPAYHLVASQIRSGSH